MYSNVLVWRMLQQRVVVLFVFDREAHNKNIPQVKTVESTRNK